MSADTATRPVSGSRLRLPGPFVFSTALALALYAFPWPEWLIYDRDAIRHGELWRLATAHWIHTDLQHLFLNIGALALMGVVWNPSARAFLAAVVSGSVIVSNTLLFLVPSLRFYCGLSAVLNTILVLTLARLWHDTHHPLVAVITIGALAKIIIELSTQQPLLSDTRWPPVVEAHLAGFITGVALLSARFHAGRMRSASAKTG